MNQELLKDGTIEELWAALASMGSYKAPGPDGFTPFFFKTNWDTLKFDLPQGSNSLLHGGLLPTNLNATNIVLIPKGKHPTQMSHFRLISLCNVMYHLFSKTIANRLKFFLPLLISESQSAFVAHRLIHDNILLAMIFCMF
ncbi:uncharacterized protein LOC132305289 [Cornus florida]|uniref:uncharacterized protein LOC132305289 n=1 Tax=Cornus florida TaxID=4283 RepID=UPI002898FAB6|nr:uncharacterized protein LOC132305289 [Cornus florida]